MVKEIVNFQDIRFKIYLLCYTYAGAQTCDCKRDWLWVRFPLMEIKYLIFSLLHSGSTQRRALPSR